MSTGTPLDLTPFGSVLSAVGILYWVLAAAALLVALKAPKGRNNKAIAVLGVIAVFGYMPGRIGWEQHQARSRSNAAMERFEERCKSAGEKISRTVQNVEGVVWMKWRPKGGSDNDQFGLDDPYGRDCGGEDCILQLLRVTKGADLNPGEARRHEKGYRFVESVDPVDGNTYRYVGVIKLPPGWTPEKIEQHRRDTGQDVPSFSHVFMLERQPIAQLTARYGITWDDVSTREDRQHWIASGSLKVMDMQANEVIAERVGYLIDRGQGSTAGFRAPWPWARSYGPSCPSVRDRSADFITKILKPTTN